MLFFAFTDSEFLLVKLSFIFVYFFSHIAPDKFYIEPRDQQSVGDQILEIDRVTQELSLAGTFVKILQSLDVLL